jgi:hypothetical protein
MIGAKFSRRLMGTEIKPRHLEAQMRGIVMRI